MPTAHDAPSVSQSAAHKIERVVATRPQTVHRRKSRKPASFKRARVVAARRSTQAPATHQAFLTSTRRSSTPSERRGGSTVRQVTATCRPSRDAAVDSSSTHATCAGRIRRLSDLSARASVSSRASRRSSKQTINSHSFHYFDVLIHLISDVHSFIYRRLNSHIFFDYSSSLQAMTCRRLTFIDC